MLQQKSNYRFHRLFNQYERVMKSPQWKFYLRDRNKLFGKAVIDRLSLYFQCVLGYLTNPQKRRRATGFIFRELLYLVDILVGKHKTPDPPFTT